MQTAIHNNRAAAGRMGSNRARLLIGARRIGRRAATANAERTEAYILRLAGTLGDDAMKHPGHRREHAAHIGGAIGLALASGILSEERAMRLRAACSGLLDGESIPSRQTSAPAKPVDSDYARVVGAVRRNRGASLEAPAALAELGRGGARAMIERLQADRVIGSADMLGFCPVLVGEG